MHLWSTPLTIGETVLEESDDLVYWDWHLIQSWLLRSIFARFPELLFIDLISRGSPGEYSMIDFLLGDAIDAIVLKYCSVCGRLHIYLKLLDRIVCGAVFLTGGVFKCNSLIVDLCQCFVCCIRSGVTRCIVFMVIYQYRMCQCGLHIGITSVHLWASSRNLAVPQHFYCPLSVSDKRSCWRGIRWYGTGGFQ